MDIKTKLAIGERVFVIWQNTNAIHEICLVCNGKKQISLNNNEYECPECYGDGYKVKYEPECWRVAQNDYATGKVRRIDIEITKKGMEINYFPWGESGNYFKEENCFKTLKEAMDECEKRNKSEVRI